MVIVMQANQKFPNPIDLLFFLEAIHNLLIIAGKCTIYANLFSTSSNFSLFIISQEKIYLLPLKPRSSEEITVATYFVNNFMSIQFVTLCLCESIICPNWLF